MGINNLAYFGDIYIHHNKCIRKACIPIKVCERLIAVGEELSENLIKKF